MRRGRTERAASVAAAALALALAVCSAVEAAGGPPPRGSDPRERGANDVLGAAQDLRASLGHLLELLEQDERRAERDAGATSALYADGAATRQDVERAACALTDARARVDEARRRIEEVEGVIAEAEAPERTVDRPDVVATARVTRRVSRSAGASGWTLAGIWRVRVFYATRFGRELPVSALGQSAVHDRLGFDHRNACDVAVRPDSPEGRALVAYLRAANIPFIAFNAAVPGKSTGAHIHVGYPSHRR